MTGVKRILLPVVGLSAIVVCVGLVGPSRIGGHLQIDAQAIRDLNQRLQFLWDQYTRMIELLITLLTGTIALSTSLVKPEVGVRGANRIRFKHAMICLMVALVCAVGWRIAAQLSMEEEVFGDPGAVQAYYNSQGINEPFATSYLYSSHSAFNRRLRVGVVALMWTTAIGLIAGLANLATFAFGNLTSEPEVANNLPTATG